MKKRTKLLILAALLVPAAMVMNTLEASEEPAGYNVGSTVSADITLKDIYGKEHTLKEYRGKGATAILFSELCKSVRGRQYEEADIVQISTENDRMLGSLRNVGIDFYKMHRIHKFDL